MTDTPKRIYAWSVPPTSNLVGTWCATRYPDAAEAYILAAEHDRMMAEKGAEIERLRQDRDNWRGRAEFAEAQFDALAEMALPPQKGLLLRRLKELAAKRAERKP